MTILNGTLNNVQHGERVVVGSMIASPGIIAEILATIRLDDFRDYAAKEVFRVVQDMHNREIPVTLAAVYQELLNAGKDVDHNVLADMFTDAGCGMDGPYFARQMREQGDKRRLKIELHEANEKLERGEVGDVLPEIAKRLADIATETQRASEFAPAIPITELLPSSDDSRFVIDGITPSTGITLFVAHPKAGKTTAQAAKFRAMQDGSQFAGRYVRKSPVLCITEEPADIWVDRREVVGLNESIHLVIQPFSTIPDQATWEKHLRHWNEVADKIGAGLIVFDTIDKLWPCLDENKATDVIRALQPIRPLAKNRAVELVHHFRKSDGNEGTGGRGSGALMGFADVIVELRRERPDGPENHRRVITTLGRPRGLVGELVIEWNPNDGTFKALGDKSQLGAENALEAVLAILPDTEPGLTTKEITNKLKAEGTSQKREYLLAALRLGFDRGVLGRTGSGKAFDGNRHYAVPVPASYIAGNRGTAVIFGSSQNPGNRLGTAGTDSDLDATDAAVLSDLESGPYDREYRP